MEPPADIAAPLLLVDDDQAALNGLTELFCSLGMQPVPCRSFADAKAFAQANPVGTLLTDVRLGDHNGLHLIQIVRTMYPSARVVAFSGYDDPVLRRDAEALGATYVVKPLDLALLLDALAGRASPEPTSGLSP
jgi:two-component system response regulator RegA